jgi:hypothetical protein
LPIAQLLLAVALLWTVRRELIQQAKDAMSFRRAVENRKPIPDVEFSVIIAERPTAELETELSTFERGFRNFERRKWIPSVMNLPVGLIQLPYVILSQSKEEWVPVGFDLMTWRAISWPLIGLLFWWSAGRGVDAMLALRTKRLAPKITIIEGVIGALFLAFCTIAAICLPLYARSDPDFPIMIFSLGFAVWAFLGGTVLFARLLQWRVANPSLHV